MNAAQIARERMPLGVFLLLALLCLVVLGFVCACLSDQPMQTLERALVAFSLLPSLIDVWVPVATGFGAAAWLAVRSRSGAASSTATLQRFLL